MATKKSVSKVNSKAYPLENSIGFLLGTTNRKLQRLLEKQVAQFGISAGTFFYLRVLWQDNGISQGDLAKRVNTSQPTTNAALRKLQEMGLVVLENDPDDGRRWTVNLTKKGRELEESVLPAMAEINRILMNGLTKEQASELRRMLQLLQANAES
jgi:DNA-binding MarR family transcriptional regulator